jgi:hypothetical protein
MWKAVAISSTTFHYMAAKTKYLLISLVLEAAL